MAISASPYDSGSPSALGLSPANRTHIGEILASTYAGMSSPSPTLPVTLTALVDRLCEALSSRADLDAKQFQAEFLAAMPSLRRFAMSLTKNQVRADDLIQDTMLKAWRARSSYSVGTNLGAWLFTIMRNNFYSSCRARAKEVFLGDDEHTNDVAVLPDQLCRLDLQDVYLAISKLPSEMREALRLVAIENKSYEEAASIMGCRLGTVKSRVCRARERLAQILGYGIDDLGADHVTLAAMPPAVALA